MKKNKLIFSLLIAVMASSCGNATKSKNTSTMSDTTTIVENHNEPKVQSLRLKDMKLTEQEWQKIKASNIKIIKGKEDFLDQDESGELELDLSCPIKILRL